MLPVDESALNEVVDGGPQIGSLTNDSCCSLLASSTMEFDSAVIGTTAHGDLSS